VVIQIDFGVFAKNLLEKQRPPQKFPLGGGGDQSSVKDEGKLV